MLLCQGNKMILEGEVFSANNGLTEFMQGE